MVAYAKPVWKAYSVARDYTFGTKDSGNLTVPTEVRVGNWFSSCFCHHTSHVKGWFFEALGKATGIHVLVGVYREYDMFSTQNPLVDYRASRCSVKIVDGYRGSPLASK